MRGPRQAGTDDFAGTPSAISASSRVLVGPRPQTSAAREGPRVPELRPVPRVLARWMPLRIDIRCRRHTSTREGSLLSSAGTCPRSRQSSSRSSQADPRAPPTSACDPIRLTTSHSMLPVRICAFSFAASGPLARDDLDTGFLLKRLDDVFSCASCVVPPYETKTNF